jgi:hypothetical protein
MTVINDLSENMPIARICRAMDISRSSVYYRSMERNLSRRSRISPEIEESILNTAEDRTTYGYRRIWAILRNSGTSVNIKAVRRIMKKHSLALPYAKHKNRTRKRDITKPENINCLWETDIHYISTTRDGMAYLMSIKDCFSKRWISYEISRSCMAKDCIMAVEKAYAERFPLSGTVKTHAEDRQRPTVYLR